MEVRNIVIATSIRHVAWNSLDTSIRGRVSWNMLKEVGGSARRQVTHKSDIE